MVWPANVKCDVRRFTDASGNTGLPYSMDFQEHRAISWRIRNGRCGIVVAFTMSRRIGRSISLGLEDVRRFAVSQTTCQYLPYHWNSVLTNIQAYDIRGKPAINGVVWFRTRSLIRLLSGSGDKLTATACRPHFVKYLVVSRNINQRVSPTHFHRTDAINKVKKRDQGVERRSSI